MTKKIPLANNKGVTLVDDADFEWLSKFNWRRVGNKGAYAGTVIPHPERPGKQQHLMMHRMILGLRPGDGQKSDHINHNKLDNRRENLRVVTAQESLRNRRVLKSRSGYKGVRRGTDGYSAVLNLGTFDSVEDAARAYDNAVRELFPGYPVNFPGEGEQSARRKEIIGLV